jgi:prepilin signal peptidase PulO-like enzyme (type II secretory pathway)
MSIDYIEKIYLVLVIVSLSTLVYLSIQDFKSKTISRNITFLLLSVVFLFNSLTLLLYNYTFAYQALLGGLVLGAVFLICVLISKEKALGMGDVYLFMVMGMLVGLERIFFALSIMVLSALFFTFVKYKKINFKQRIPLVPFITIGIFLTVLFSYLFF